MLVPSAAALQAHATTRPVPPGPDTEPAADRDRMTVGPRQCLLQDQRGQRPPPAAVWASASERLQAFRARRSQGLQLRLAVSLPDLARTPLLRARQADARQAEDWNTHGVAPGGESACTALVQDVLLPNDALPLLDVALSPDGLQPPSKRARHQMSTTTMAIKRPNDDHAARVAAHAANARPTPSSLRSAAGHV